MEQVVTTSSQIAELRQQAFLAWQVSNPDEKCLAVMALGKHAAALSPSLLDDNLRLPPLDCEAGNTDNLEPGRPETPRLVHPSRLARRRTGTRAGRAAMLHAIAHIEFNAINLALDAVWRFDRMPAEFVADWISVAVDEARHFQMLTIEMARDKYLYGDFDAHDGLWMMSRRTVADCQARMAVVPRVMEARGLDATPVIQKKLASVGDQAGVDILQVILDEEIRHVRIGDFWFRQICRQRQQQPDDVFRDMVVQFDAPRPNGWINREARLSAGFSEAELSWLSGR